MKYYLQLALLFISYSLYSQSNVIGFITDEDQNPVEFATVVLKSSKDSTIVKVETSDENGAFKMQGITLGSYFTEISLIGFQTLSGETFQINESNVTLPKVTLSKQSQKLDEVVVTATRPMVEIKPDRTVFNVQGTINSIGDNLINLLRKAPGVLLDNNDNITVLGRSGVLVYVDGRRLPLSGQDLTNYLQSITSDQIDRIDIITNPSAKYEAEGNAGIIDIRLKKDKNLGYNLGVNATYSQGKYHQASTNFNSNYRSKKANVFANAGYADSKNWNEMGFQNFQNNLYVDEYSEGIRDNSNINAKLGVDIFTGAKSTLGFLYTGNFSNGNGRNNSSSRIASIKTINSIDSVLIANNESEFERDQHAFNINYALEIGKTKFNLDGDYAIFQNISNNFQPNEYYKADLKTILTERNVYYETPSDINIGSVKFDAERPIKAGAISYGLKYTNVVTDNTFSFFNAKNGTNTFNPGRSNNFKYSEGVSAAYSNFNYDLSQALKLSGGLRLEHTLATGTLTTFVANPGYEPSEFNYLSVFPSMGLSYQKNPMHAYSLNYGRRINRPDYNVLNPFREQISELSFSKGNEKLLPEIVNNVEAGYTYKYMYNFKLAYSLTTDQITRLIGPDDSDPRAGFISYDNLATQQIFSFNFSAPFNITKWWNIYFNFNANYTDNQADYGQNGKVDVQTGNYNFYQQQTFSLPKDWKFETSGWYSGPGVWGGVFIFEPMYSLNFGLQKRIFNNKVNMRLSASDVFFQSGWSGESNFNGLRGVGFGNYDSRRLAISLGYDFGNNNVKSRKRATGIESESNRVK